MATTSPTLEQPATQAAGTSLLICLPALPHEIATHFLGLLSEALQGIDAMIALPDAGEFAQGGTLRVVSYTPTAPSSSSWTLTAADFLNAHELVQTHHASTILILGADAQSLEISTLRVLAQTAIESGNDLIMPRYALASRAGLVNSAVLYPVSRALFGVSARFPLAIDLGLSARMAEKLAIVAQRFTALNQSDAIVWPVAEAALAGYKITQVEVGTRTFPQPTAPDLNAILAHIAGSLFADVETKAALWQRSRLAQPQRSSQAIIDGTAVPQEEITPMVDAYRLAYTNLQEIWSLVLPPQSLLGLKRLSVMPAENFAMPDSLWARIVYDFLMAYRLRTLNRGHLLGALTPLYLAWVASHLLQTNNAHDPEKHIEAVAAAFETDKAYLVSRWRWPDRFNP
jgi:hypothetical protein